MVNGLVYAMGIDPGGTSGWSIIGVHERTIYRDYPGRISYFAHGQVTGSHTSQVLELMRIAQSKDYFPLAIALESFTPRKLGIDYAPMLVGARIQFCIDTYYVIRPLFYQTPEMAMSTATDARLKEWGLYVPGPDHIKDATRHAITFIRRAKQSEALRTKAWGSTKEQRQRAHDGQRMARTPAVDRRKQNNNVRGSLRQDGRDGRGARRGITRARRTLY